MDILGNGWNISQKGEEIITENNIIKDKATILKNALDSDLKEISTPILTKIHGKSNISQVVLQIQKIRNVSAPKANENSHAAPRMLKLVLSDGDGYIQAIEISPINSINPDKTPPGSKILIHSAKISSGYLLLDSNNFSLLGGKVSALYEKWELAKSVQAHNRQNSSNDGAPAWVNFGCKIQSDIQDKSSFKSLVDKNQDGKENTKFDLQRQDAIAEATSGGAVKKVFGGGTKLPVQQQSSFVSKNRPDFQNKDKRNAKIKSNNMNEAEEKPQKPSERVSLFDFLEDKLPVNETSDSGDFNKPPAIIYKNNPRNVQNTQFNNRNTNYKSHQQQYPKFTTDQNQSRTRSDFKVQPQQHYSQYRAEENRVNGLCNNFEKVSLNNTQFASRSLKQHLNLGPQKKNNVDVDKAVNIAWKVGDDCVAKYWEDGKYYNASITAVTDRTCVVKFKGYGNLEEVLKNDCLPVTSKEAPKSHYLGPVVFRRSAKTYRKE